MSVTNINKNIQEPRGTRTLFEQELRKRDFLISKLSALARSIGFGKIQTPTFEYSSLFLDSQNSENEILKKELFFLQDGEYALKPEETAVVSKAVAVAKLCSNNPNPLKFFYSSQCFRHERPQKQRFREFTQFGFEIINASSLNYEIELIYMLDSFLRKEFKLNSLKLRVNYLSKRDTRRIWTEELTEYFLQNNEGLSENSLDRIYKNPIRILDDERDSKLDIVKNVPKISQFFSEREIQEVERIKNILSELGIDYVWDESLVRGLDYYTGIVFEWGFDGIGIAGGGRYDELFKKFNSNYNNIPSVGLAIGIERLLDVVEKSGYKWPKTPNRKVYFCNLLEGFEPRILKLIKKLRDNELEVESNWDTREIKAHFKFSEKLGIRWLLIYGPREKEREELILKEQNKSFQIAFNLSQEDELIRELQHLVEYEL